MVPACSIDEPPAAERHRVEQGIARRQCERDVARGNATCRLHAERARQAGGPQRQRRADRPLAREIDHIAGLPVAAQRQQRIRTGHADDAIEPRPSMPGSTQSPGVTGQSRQSAPCGTGRAGVGGAMTTGRGAGRGGAGFPTHPARRTRNRGGGEASWVKRMCGSMRDARVVLNLWNSHDRRVVPHPTRGIVSCDHRTDPPLLQSNKPDTMTVRSRDGDKLGTLHALMVNKRHRAYRLLRRTDDRRLSRHGTGVLPAPLSLLAFDPVNDTYVVTIDRRGARRRPELGRQRAGIRPGLCRPRVEILTMLAGED